MHRPACRPIRCVPEWCGIAVGVNGEGEGLLVGVVLRRVVDELVVAVRVVINDDLRCRFHPVKTRCGAWTSRFGVVADPEV